MGFRLLRIYTPFICALAAIIHGVLYLTHYEGMAYHVLSEFTGHSLILLLYVLSTSRRMCKWYKMTVYLLLGVHILNLLYLFTDMDYYVFFYTGLVTNIMAVICFLIFRFTRGVSKIMC